MVKTQSRTNNRAAKASRERSAKSAHSETDLADEPPATAEKSLERRLDAFPDRIDLRDWVYRPHLAPLPDLLINCDSVPEILDQGREGACTGFALAAVINFQLSRRRIRRRVSPRMIYEMARRYDEWPGEQYEGSSARGALKGWVAHGVCVLESWPSDRRGLDHFTFDVAREARTTPGGAYYRVMHREIRDMHAALAEAGILYATLMVHRGWANPGRVKREIVYVDQGNLRTLELPVIERLGRSDSGHAIAIVGFTGEGFVVQNSWGPGWGNNGFALLPYEDYLLHATDVWVAQVGVPVELDLWAREQATDSMAGMHRATPVIPLNTIRPFVVDIGNNGELSQSGKYWTTDNDLRRLFSEEIPRHTGTWEKIRVLLYLHGGLNDEQNVARRIVAFRDVMLENEVYPLHIMWESGIHESLTGLVRDLFTDVDDRAAGPAEWLERFRQGLVEAKDWSLELTAALPGSMLWNEMKEDARLASDHPDGIGGMQLLARHVKEAVGNLPEEERDKVELHVIGHSAGSIFAAHALRHLLDLGIALASIQFFAPAITVELFKRLVLPPIEAKKCPHPTLYVLSDDAEQDDTVGPYGKSLLYLVSNAFEGRRNVPLLGMQRFLGDENGTFPDADPKMNALFRKEVAGLPCLVVAGGATNGRPDAASVSHSKTHGGFDNDPATLNSALRRIVAGDLKRPFKDRDLQF